MSLTATLEGALAQAASADGRTVIPVSFSLDYGVPADGPLTIEARIDRATRSLVFVHGEAIAADGRRAATASAVFRTAQG
jgi:acyl-coenzyme A thioesterase PaaI-like protein